MAPFLQHTSFCRKVGPLRAGIDCLTECVSFSKQFWLHLLFLIPGALVVTFLHEFFHGAAVVLQGGRVTEFVFLPTKHVWGYILYRFPPGYPFSQFIISMAPYCVSFFVCFFSFKYSQYVVFRKPWKRTAFYFWLYIIPAGDIVYAAWPYLLFSNRNDFYQAFGPVSIPVVFFWYGWE